MPQCYNTYVSKILLFDADGVIIRPRHKYFSEKFSEDYNVPLSEVTSFFKTEYKKSAIGEVDIKNVLPPYLQKWGWNKSVEEFLTYWFESERDLDTQIVKLIQELRKKGVKCYLVSDNEKNRADYLMKNLNLKDSFDGAFFSHQLGTTKSDPAFFEKILKSLSLDPANVVYWDDDSKNVEVARSVKIDAYQYGDYGEFIRKMDKLFPNEMVGIQAFDTNDFYCDLVFSGKIAIQKVKETDKLLAFYHTRPSWSTHIVIVPKQHVANLMEVADIGLISEVFSLAKDIIFELGLDKINFRIITNGGSFQDSKHLHFHLVSGSKTGD